MNSRMKNPVAALPEALKPIQELMGAIRASGLPTRTFDLVHLRASQINGCSFCVDAGARSARGAGETEERLMAVAAWRETSYFTEAERAALVLAEAATRLADRADAVPDAVWEDVARQFDEKALAGLVLAIGLTNLFNRINAVTRQPAGAWKPKP